MKTYSLSILVLVLVAASSWAVQDGSGLQTSVAVDIAGQAGLEKGSGASDRLDLREAEVAFMSPVDHLFEGMASFAAHYEGTGVANVEVHEAYIGSSKIIPRSRFRVGQYFLGIGRLNQFHRHDWPFITAPKVQREFLDTEGVLDTGIEYAYLLPVPHFIEVTGGMTNGFVFGHSHTAGLRPLFPTHYGRIASYFSLPWDGGTQIGLNYLGRRAADGSRMTLLGFDVTAKWKHNQVLQFFFQSEIWYRTRTSENSIGFYVYPQYYLGENFYLGLRVDYFKVLKDSTGATDPSSEWALVPTVSYKPSEFSTIRLAYNYIPKFQNSHNFQTDRYFEAQAIFILGSHPAHDF